MTTTMFDNEDNYVPFIVFAKVQQDYELLISFSDGSIKTFDFSEIVKDPQCKFFSEPKVFAKFFVKHGAIYWKVGNRELAYDPCELYYYGKDLNTTV
ncbi:MAG: DUF2442 domain-containing protein [Succinivibrio sp.]|nr:DUF2442 domain-containing protein [Succinivibrio sp.]MDD6068098.1 DUF2442 domain-containing protein [Succinivibrio sp.]MDY4992993.1 DUF2442 domain-containing protein [Succinivibrio sp.]